MLRVVSGVSSPPNLLMRFTLQKPPCKYPSRGEVRSLRRLCRAVREDVDNGLRELRFRAAYHLSEEHFVRYISKFPNAASITTRGMAQLGHTALEALVDRPSLRHFQPQQPTPF